RQAWQGQTAAQVEGALADATLLRGQRKWSEATTAMQRALASLDAGQPTEQLRRHVQEKSTALAKEGEQARREADRAGQNQQLVAALTKMRVFGGSSADEAYLESWDTNYADTFSAYGLPLDDLSVDEGARQVQERGIAEHVSSALDDWIFVRRKRK